MNTQVSNERCSNCKFWDHENRKTGGYSSGGYSECLRFKTLDRIFTQSDYKCEYFEKKKGAN